MKYDIEKIKELVEIQLKNIFNYEIDTERYQQATIDRVEKCFSASANKYYTDENSCFSTFHSVQYSIYLYYLSNTMYRLDKNGNNAEKVYYLNKVLNSVDWFYAIELPDVFSAEHPLGSVMGRAIYGNNFFFYQGCTVGGNKFKYPEIGSNVLMYSDSKILGDSHIGNNVILSANSYIVDTDIPDNCIVFGQSQNLTIKQKSEAEIRKKTEHIWKY